MSKKEKSTFSHFFREDAENVQDIIHNNTNEAVLNTTEESNKDVIPRITRPKEVTEEAFRAQWQKLRSFFRNGNNAQGLPPDFWPVLMTPFYTNSMTTLDYPIWVADENYDGEGAYCSSLKEIIIQSLNKIGPGENDQVLLKKNIDRILIIANQQVKNKKSQLFQTALTKILDVLEKELDVSGEDAEKFKSDLQTFKNDLPKTGLLLPYSNTISFQILEAAMLATHGQKRKRLKQEVNVLISKLNDLLQIEREKGPERNNPDKLHDSLSFVDSMMKFDELSSLSPDGGSELMGEERIKRISTVLKDLDEAGKMMDQPGFIFIDKLLHDNKDIEWDRIFENASIDVFDQRQGSEVIRAAFEKQMNVCNNFFVAKRIGELELENNYQADIHDEYFQHFDWQSFSTDELNCCPHFILIVDDSQLFEVEFRLLSTMLSDNIPVNILAIRKDYFEDHNQNNSEKEKEKENLHTQAELGALMLSFKNIYVTQTTSITPNYLFQGFKEGLSVFAPSFFYVMNVDEKNHDNPFAWTSAAIEGRDFPGFTFKGLLGTPWGSRFEIDNNPHPTRSWPIHNLKIINENGDNEEIDIPFTFADQAVLKTAYHHYYLPVNSSFWSDDLIPVTDYMKNSTEDNIGKVPFIWMMDSAKELHKVALSWPIVIAAQERLDFWRFLQENSGINNYHVGHAVEQIKEEMKGVHDFELDNLKKEHETEIQAIKEEEAAKVMENLTSVLLDLDTSSLITNDKPSRSPNESPKPLSKSEEITEEQPPEEKIEVVENMLSNDPYIDTVLCTTCDECMGLNKDMFKYNADNKAYIADATAGTFKQMVEAAELCPVGIIHPGSPLNKDEPDMDSLVERADKFN